MAKRIFSLFINQKNNEDFPPKSIGQRVSSKFPKREFTHFVVKICWPTQSASADVSIFYCTSLLELSIGNVKLTSHFFQYFSSSQGASVHLCLILYVGLK